MSAEQTLQRLALTHEVAAFLYLEADLADNHRYDEWLALWAQELLYWVPCNADTIDPAQQVSIIYDDFARLEERLFRLKTKHAHSQNPRSRLSRTVANICLHDFNADGGVVTSRFTLGESRQDRITTWIGSQRHVLERDGTSFKIREKRVLLINNDSPMGNLTFVV